MIALVRPNPSYKQSFLEALYEFQLKDSGLESTRALQPSALEADFEGFVARRLNMEHSDNLEPGMVAQSDFWLVDDDCYVGLLKLRHTLNAALSKLGGHIGYEVRPSKRRMGYATRMLALGLLEARRLGLQRVLLTCDDNNVASYKVMEHNGARLEDVIRLPGRLQPTRRYWIELP